MAPTLPKIMWFLAIFCEIAIIWLICKYWEYNRAFRMYLYRTPPEALKKKTIEDLFGGRLCYNTVKANRKNYILVSMGLTFPTQIVF